MRYICPVCSRVNLIDNVYLHINGRYPQCDCGFDLAKGAGAADNSSLVHNACFVRKLCARSSRVLRKYHERMQVRCPWCLIVVDECDPNQRIKCPGCFKSFRAPEMRPREQGRQSFLPPFPEHEEISHCYNNPEDGNSICNTSHSLQLDNASEILVWDEGHLSGETSSDAESEESVDSDIVLDFEQYPSSTISSEDAGYSYKLKDKNAYSFWTPGAKSTSSSCGGGRRASSVACSSIRGCGGGDVDTRTTASTAIHSSARRSMLMQSSSATSARRSMMTMSSSRNSAARNSNNTVLSEKVMLQKFAEKLLCNMETQEHEELNKRGQIFLDICDEEGVIRVVKQKKCVYTRKEKNNFRNALREKRKFDDELEHELALLQGLRCFPASPKAIEINHNRNDDDMMHIDDFDADDVSTCVVAPTATTSESASGLLTPRPLFPHEDDSNDSTTEKNGAVGNINDSEKETTPPRTDFVEEEHHKESDIKGSEKENVEPLEWTGPIFGEGKAGGGVVLSH